MADRDYRVTYKTRELDRDSDRYDEPQRRIPTALDPYLYPEDRDELKRAVAETKARNARLRDEYLDYAPPPARRDTMRDGDDLGVSTSAKDSARAVAGTTKTTYSVTGAGLAKESEVVSRAPTSVGAASVSRAPTRHDLDDYDSPRTSGRSISSAKPYPYEGRDREFSRVERTYEVERPRREPGGYVVEVNDADIVGIRSGPGLVESDRGFAGHRGDPYNYEPLRKSYTRERERERDREFPIRDSAPISGYRQSEATYVERESPRTSAPPLRSEGAYMSGARQDRDSVMGKSGRSQADVRGPARTGTRTYDDAWESTSAVTVPYVPSRVSGRREDDEYAFIEKTTTRDRAPTIRDNEDQKFRDPFRDERTDPSRGRDRVQASQYTRAPSEADYVMVSPPPKDNGTSVNTSAVASRRQSEAPESRSARSAMFRNDSYTAEERLDRRRSRSINFRDADYEGHCRGDKFCERPGAEAAMMGRYLKRYDVDDEDDDRRERGTDRKEYQAVSKSASGRRDTDARDLDRRGDGGRIERERGTDRYGSRARSKSRGPRREEDDDDDQSYYDTYRKKTSKTTYF